MKFTIVMPSMESEDLSIGCLFIPCLLWKINQREILVPHRNNPHYLPGDFQYMLDETRLKDRVGKHSKRVVLVTHGIGHGTTSYREQLRTDIESVGFQIILIDL